MLPIRRLAFICTLGIFSLANAQSFLTTLAPSPLGVALTIGQWLIKDSQKVYYVQVESSGKDRESARNLGLKLATELAVGSIIVSETKIQNKELISDEIIKHSSGFIYDFKVISEKVVDAKIILTMDVWVIPSQIADRILNESEISGKFDGLKIATQKETYSEKNASSEQMLKLVLKDYPNKAFNLTLGKTGTSLTNGKVEIYIPIEIAWSDVYLNALLDSINATKDSSGVIPSGLNTNNVISFRKRGGWINYYASYNDQKKLNLIRHYLIESEPQISVSFIDAANEEMGSYCFQIPQFNGGFIGDAKLIVGKDNSLQPQGQFVASPTPYSTIGIYGDHEVSTTLKILNIQDPKALKKIDSIQAKVIAKLDCFDPNSNVHLIGADALAWCSKNPKSGKLFCPDNLR